MKLIIAIVRDEDGAAVIKSLNKEGFSVTKLATTGGFLKSGNMTLLIGTEDESIDTAIDIIKQKCQKRSQVVVSPSPATTVPPMYSAFPVEIDVGGATIFVLDIERFEKI